MEVKKILEDKFNISIKTFELLGSGNDSNAYLINNEYVFKIRFNKSKTTSYVREKEIYDFLNKNLSTNIQLPKIEFSYISKNLEILGYKRINGIFLNPKLYHTLNLKEQDQLKIDIANFLKSLHNLDYKEIGKYKHDIKKDMLEKCEFVNKIQNQLSIKEKEYIDYFIKKVNNTKLFEENICLCHNDFSCNHLLIDKNNKLCGIIDFGDAGIMSKYNDFVYLLEDSEEEIGASFGKDIISIYGNLDIEKVQEYHNLIEAFYPIELIVYGIQNNKEEIIDEGKNILKNGIYDF